MQCLILDEDTAGLQTGSMGNLTIRASIEVQSEHIIGAVVRLLADPMTLKVSRRDVMAIIKTKVPVYGLQYCSRETVQRLPEGHMWDDAEHMAHKLFPDYMG